MMTEEEIFYLESVLDVLNGVDTSDPVTKQEVEEIRNNVLNLLREGKTEEKMTNSNPNNLEEVNEINEDGVYIKIGEKLLKVTAGKISVWSRETGKYVKIWG